MNTHAYAQHAQNVPALSALWQLTTMEYPPGVNAGYMPAITAPPTSMNVILAILNRTVECMNTLELNFIFDNIIVQMGGFHMTMCLTKTFYSRFPRSGLVELLSEAGVQCRVRGHNRSRVECTTVHTVILHGYLSN